MIDKKIQQWFTIILTLLTFSASVLDAACETVQSDTIDDTETLYKDVLLIRESGRITAVEFTASNTRPQTGNLYVAAYDSSAKQRLKGIVMSAVSLNGTQRKISIPLESTMYCGDTDTVRVFLWTDTLKPLSKAEPHIADRASIYIQNNAQNGDGSYSAPFGSLAEARDCIREMKRNQTAPNGGIAVYLRGGTYAIDQMTEFTEEDSGTESAPILYSAYKNETVKFVGGMRFNIDDFTSVTDPMVISRLDSATASEVKQLNLRSLGIDNYGEIANIGHSTAYYDYVNYPYNKLEPIAFFEDQTLHLARWPNDGTVSVASVVSEVLTDVKIDVPGYYLSNDQKYIGRYVGDIFVADDECGERMKRWSQAEDPWLYGRLYKDYTDLSVHILGMNPETKELNIEWIPQNINIATQFYVYNLLEELDMPGEWYLNRNTGILYLYPPAESGNVLLVMLDTPMIKLDNVEYVKFSGLSFLGTKDALFDMTSCGNVLFENCEFSRSANNGVRMSSCTNCGIVDCKFDSIYGIAAVLSGGDRISLESGQIFVENSYFHDVYQALTLKGVGAKIRHNKIERTSYIAIGCEGNDHIIEYNEFKNCVTKGTDLGVIYQYMSKSMRGTVIRNNLFHDIAPEKQDQYGIQCIYWDGGADGITIEQNLFVNVDGYGFLLNGGRDCSFKNNLAVNVSKGMVRHSAIFTLEGEVYDTIREKILGKDSGLTWLGLPTSSLEEVKSVYGKYPHFINILEDEICEPRYNTVKQNACINSVPWGQIDVTFEQANAFYGCDMEKPYLFASDPGFADMQAGNYTLKQDAPLYSIYPDFKAPDFTNMGMYKN